MLMKKLFTAICILSVHLLPAQNITTIFEKSNRTKTPTYYEIIEWWQKLDAQSGKVKMLTMGMSDAGFPLHLAVVANNGDHNFDNIRKTIKELYWSIMAFTRANLME